MLKKLPKRKLRKTVTFARAAKKQPRIDAVSLTEQEIAVSKALTALCGGSGVGQAPEPPQRAVARETGEFLPKPPPSLQETSEKQKAKSEKITYELGEMQESEQEKKIIARESLKIQKPEKPKEQIELEKKEKGEFKIPGRVYPRNLFRFALQTISYACIILAFAGFVFAYGPVIQAETGFQWKQWFGNNKREKVEMVAKGSGKTEKVKELPKTNVNEFKDINFVADTSIAIPKIDAYAEIVPNVDPSNYPEYMAALQKGVAHAKGTALPGMVGNVYLFAHSAGNLFDIARFNAVFYLIGKLDKGDAIYVKFGNTKYKYTVVDKKEVDPTDVQFLTKNLGKIGDREGIKGIGEGDRTLTLQTCVPPGTDWRRLLVFAKIEN